MTYSSAVKVLIYSQDGFGLGHLRRNLNICAQIEKLHPRASCLVIADSPVAPFFKLPPNCDFIKIPTIVKVDTGIWRPDRLSMGYRELLAIRSDMIQNIAVSFQPDVFLVDHMPHGALGELAEPLQVIRKQSPHTRIVLGLRDILGAPEVIHPQWEKEGAFAAIAEFYNAVLIYGCAAFFMDQFIEAACRLPLRFHALITTGPFMHQDQRDLLRHKTKELPIVVSQAGDSIRYLQRADLVISMAGYNTISEILHFRKNAIVVPRAGPSAEQSMRTRIMSKRGLFKTIHPINLTAKTLSELITQRLGNEHHIHEAMIPNMDGASKVASVILGA